MSAAAGGFGGLIQGEFGNYNVGADGTLVVDTRDVHALLARGVAFTKQISEAYTLPMAPAAATSGRVFASGALSNGTVAVANQPDVMRQVTVEVGTGTTAITAGNLAVTYAGNDGLTGTDTISLVCPLSASTTQFLSRGVVTISSMTVSGLVGGTAPWLRMSTTAAISLPVDQQPAAFVITREYDANATIAIGAVTAATVGTVTPTTAPNGTVTYSFMYNYVSPVQ
jgi:hypothetical protein